MMRNPFLGSFDFMNTPEMEALRQGQGIIDLVNSYATVGLSSGLVGLSLFLGFFMAVLFRIFKGMRSLPDKNGEMYLLGQVLFSVLLGILVMIAAVSSIMDVPWIYWSVAGLGVGYARMVARAKSHEAAKAPRFQPGGAKIGSSLKSPIPRPQPNVNRTPNV